MLLAMLLATSGCHRSLVATPTLLQAQDPQRVFGGCPVDCQSPVASVLYATDRANQTSADRSPAYGHERANNLAFGVAEVSLDPRATWKELIQDSTRANRHRDYALKLAEVRELGHMQGTVNHVKPDEANKAHTLAVLKKQTELSRFHELLQTRLSQTSQKDVYIFVHGLNSRFEDSVFRAAEVWHFMGRVGVPIAYSWPAGHGGLRGFAYDRESGEFTVSHLRHFLTAVANCPDVERVHLIAHSRGADVTIAALRELHLVFTAQGRSTQQELKLENVVLAAPDVDEDVFVQRFVGENLLEAAQRTTIYASEHDKVIELANLVFAGRRRVGALAVEDFRPKVKSDLAKLSNLQFIQCKVSGWQRSHNYVFTHPAALSDLILVLRDRRPPGAENGRPLRQPAEGLWELTDDYLVTAK